MSVIRVRILNEFDDIPARSLNVRHYKGSFITPAYAVNGSDINSKFINYNNLLGVSEIFLTFKLEYLKKIHELSELRQRFEHRVNSYITKIPDGQLIVAIPLIEGKKDALSQNKASLYGEHVAELISHPSVDIVCTPVFHNIADDNVDILVKKFLDTITSLNTAVALSIPYIISRAKWFKLIELYLRHVNKNNRALPNFLCVDYNGSNPIVRYALHNFVLKYVKDFQEELDEPIIIYGINVKYDKVAKKYDELPARDLATYFTQVDIWGKNHKRNNLPREVAARLKAEESLKKQKLLNRKRYTYVSLDNMILNSELAIPEVSFVEKLINESYHRTSIERMINFININNLISEIDILRTLFSGQGWRHFEKPIEYLNSKEIVKIDNKLLKTLEKYAKILRLNRKKLDEYF